MFPNSCFCAALQTTGVSVVLVFEIAIKYQQLLELASGLPLPLVSLPSSLVAICAGRGAKTLHEEHSDYVSADLLLIFLVYIKHVFAFSFIKDGFSSVSSQQCLRMFDSENHVNETDNIQVLTIENVFLCWLCSTRCTLRESSHNICARCTNGKKCSLKPLQPSGTRSVLRFNSFESRLIYPNYFSLDLRLSAMQVGNLCQFHYTICQKRCMRPNIELQIDLLS